MNASWRIVLAAVIVLACPAGSSAQNRENDPARLTVDRIFDSGEFAGKSFSGAGAPMVAAIPCSFPRPNAGPGAISSGSIRNGEPRGPGSASRLVPPGGGQVLNVERETLSADESKLLIFTNSRRVWRTNSRGDYWVLDRTSRELRKLGAGAPPSSLMHAKFSPDGNKVAYIHDNNLWVEDLHDGTVTRLTNSTTADEINGTFDWVYEEELSLRDGFRWGPDSRSIAYWQINTKGVREFPLVNNTAGLYPKVSWIKYPKVGERNAACRVGVVDTQNGETRWLDVPGDSRDHYIAFLEWAPSKGEKSPEIVLQQLNRLQNTVRVMLANPTTGKTRTVLTEKDDAWVDHQPKIRWINGGTHFLWLSERDGWRHLYRVDRAGNTVAPITQGDFDVHDLAGVDEAAGWVYVHASLENSTQRYLYKARLDGSTRSIERVTPAALTGTHDDQISPDGRWSFHHESSFETPPRIDLVRLPSHERVRVLADNEAIKKKLAVLKGRPIEFLRVKIAADLTVDGWRIVPPDFDPAKKYPLLVHVYGEPASRTVVDAWGSANALWHRMLAQQGYVVMSFDNRGNPAPRGRAWRKSVYRKIGVLAPQDQAAALKAVLNDCAYLDPKRVGIWGWSGGGSMSLNAIFKYPDLYTTAIAVAPVSNQRYYDTIYQERYMGLPGDNVEGFEKGSPINFASQLKGKLLLIHGTGDDNCHYQATEALINELVRHDKSFTMMAYPNRSHSIHEGANTTRHLRSLMTRFLRENLPTGG